MSEHDNLAADAAFESEWADLLSRVRPELGDRLPSALLEERTVRELRRRGLLRPRRSFPAAWITGSIAASIALFALGVATGQYLGSRSTASVVAGLQSSDDPARAAAQVQRAGSAYVNALAALSSAARQDRTGAAASAEAREVALTALHEAANEVVRLAPNDPVAVKILQGIEQERRQSQANAGRQTDRQIVWF